MKLAKLAGISMHIFKVFSYKFNLNFRSLVKSMNYRKQEFLVQ